MIESFVVRRTVCGIPTNRLRRVFAQMSTQTDSHCFVESSRAYLLNNEWPRDEIFRSEFVQYSLYLRSRVPRARLVLTALEQSFGHKEMPELTPEVSIEHIMPQKLSSEWKEHLGEDADKIHDQWRNTIGNLTLTGYNSSLGNWTFSKKKEILADTNFALSASIQKFDVWNEDSIQRRGQELAERALKIWPR